MAGSLLFDLFEKIDAVDLRHPNIQEHESGFFLRNQLQNAGAVGGVDNSIALVAEDFSDRLTDFVLVVDNQYGLLCRPLFHHASQCSLGMHRPLFSSLQLTLLFAPETRS